MAVRSTNTVTEALDSVMQTLASALLYPDSAPYVDFITDLMARIQARIQAGQVAQIMPDQGAPPNALPSSNTPNSLSGANLSAMPVPPTATAGPEFPLPGVMAGPNIQSLVGNPDEVRRMLTATRRT